MGESLLSRSTLIPEEILNPIDPVAGYCVMVIRVKDYNNKPIPGLRVTCNAGTQALNYNTNEKGAVMFTINNGMANIFLNNFLNNNVRICDYGARWVNSVEAPVGTVQNINYQLNRLSNTNLTSGNYNYIFRDTSSINFVLSGGGGGGGGGGYVEYNTSSGWRAYGGDGGRGYTNKQYNIAIDKNQIYVLNLGAGGRGGRGNTAKGTAEGSNGYSGSTSVFMGFYAAGGSGGERGIAYKGSAGYNGQDGSGGDGAYGGSGTYHNGGNGASGYINITFKY